MSVILDSARQVYDVLQSSRMSKSDGDSRRHFCFVERKEIDSIRSLAEKVKKKLKTVKGTREIHQVISSENSTISHRPLSCYCVKDMCQHTVNNNWTHHRFSGNS